MIAQILSNTPTWVFVLFVGLLVVGLLQTRTRTVRRIPALVRPLFWVAFSLVGIRSNFGIAPLASWAVALALSSVVAYTQFRERRVQYDASTQKFWVPGSWTPLFVILAIFFTKYAHAVMHAMKADVIAAPWFPIALSAVYGLLSGYFAARAFNLLKTIQKAKAA